MGRKPVGQTAKTEQVNVRLDATEAAELRRKSTARGLSRSMYFRTLLREDPR